MGCFELRVVKVFGNTNRGFGIYIHDVKQAFLIQVGIVGCIGAFARKYLLLSPFLLSLTFRVNKLCSLFIGFV